MPYTRSFPITINNFRPGNNPVYTGKCFVDANAYGANKVFGISTSNMAAAGTYTDPMFVIYMGNTSNNDLSSIGNYKIASYNPMLGVFELLDFLSGTPTLLDGTYNYRLFDGAFPNSNDLPCEAIVFSTVPFTDVEVYLTSGQYVEIDPAAFIDSAIYTISVSRIVSDGGGAGVLLGAYGVNGNAFIS